MTFTPKLAPIVEDEAYLTVSLWLHGKPGQALEENEAVTSAQVKQYADDLHEWLVTVAETLSKLEADGWDLSMSLYDVSLTHPEVATPRQARARLKRLGLNTKHFHIHAD